MFAYIHIYECNNNLILFGNISNLSNIAAYAPPTLYLHAKQY